MYNMSEFPIFYFTMKATIKQGSGSYDPSNQQYFNAQTGDICEKDSFGNWTHTGDIIYVPAGTYTVVGYWYDSGYPIISYNGKYVQMYH